MEKILGIDTGTNSLGWAIVEKNNDEYKLLDKGSNIFQEGVKIEKGIESSKAAERTEHRSVRRHYFRRKVRKIRLLTILIENHLCPPISKEDLRKWRLHKVYPINELFMSWQRTEDKENVNPYHFRYLCLTQKLDLSDITQRYILGRALYHINQRRGFLSNRKDTTKASDGEVSSGINNLTVEIAEAGCEYLGEYFYKLYERGEKIRSHYTARKEHYLKEFEAICAKQDLDKNLVDKLRKAIFSQRPLKSQKGLVGTCTFEKGKARCSSSHPLYEDFRMYSFINNIKIQTPKDDALRNLTDEEKKKIIPKFKRKSKKTFPFEEIAKELAGKNNYCYYKDASNKPYKFNYQMDTNVSGSVVNAQLEDIFGEQWLDAVCEVYTLAGGKTRFEIMNDIWHVLFFFDDEKKLKEFAINKLQLDDDEASKFSKIKLPNDYASLSLKAIRKIIPYLRDFGMIYSKAVFLANLKEVLPRYIWNVAEMRNAAIERIIDLIDNLDSNTDERTLECCIKDFIRSEYNVDDKTIALLYHPSMIDLYPKAKQNDEGVYQLGSPRINSVKNPMAMHSLFRLRKVINTLLKEGKIDENTKIHIEFSRDLNDANKRKAIQSWQRQNEKSREDCRRKIAELYTKECGKQIIVTDTDILKYQLWEEQNHKCIYTGSEICICDFLGEDPQYDIEHTIPRSVGGDSTKMNLTLCNSKYNREIKKTKLPSELSNIDEILKHIVHWKEKYESLDKQIRKLKGISTASKEEKDKIIQRRHQLTLERDYWRGKYERFKMKEVPEGFSRRQGTDISVISRYARLYLKSVFKHVYIVKSIATSDFRKIWGIQDEYSKKERVNHVHHCIDAITIACIGKEEYDKLAQYYHDEENHQWYGHTKAHFKKPWDSFVNDIKHIQDELLIAHYSKDNMPKQAKRYIKTSKSDKRLSQGDTSRGSLHNDTYYGAINVDGEIKYVVRKSLDKLEEKDVKNIVDTVVREKVEDAIKEHKNLKAAVEAGIWMNEEKKIPIKKVRLYATSITRPLNIRSQRDLSRHEYKQQYHVQNDRNYMMGIYIGKNKSGKEKREFELINNLMAADFYKRSNGKLSTEISPLPQCSKSGYPLVYSLKIGTMVILYENNPDEVWELDKQNLQKRLYKVTGMSSMIVSACHYGTIELIHHQDARPSGEVKKKNGVFLANEEFRSGIKLLHSQIKALVQGIDFELKDLGEIKRLI